MNRSLVLAAVATVATLYPSAAVRSHPVGNAAVQACMSNPACTATLIYVGGAAYWQIQNSIPPRHIPLAPMMGDPGNVTGVQETHGAVNRSDCQRMEKQFQRQGRKVSLKEIKPSGNPGAALRYICIFEGSDATVGYYDRYRR